MLHEPATVGAISAALRWQRRGGTAKSGGSELREKQWAALQRFLVSLIALAAADLGGTALADTRNLQRQDDRAGHRGREGPSERRRARPRRPRRRLRRSSARRQELLRRALHQPRRLRYQRRAEGRLRRRFLRPQLGADARCEELLHAAACGRTRRAGSAGPCCRGRYAAARCRRSAARRPHHRRLLPQRRRRRPRSAAPVAVPAPTPTPTVPKQTVTIKTDDPIVHGQGSHARPPAGQDHSAWTRMP